MESFFEDEELARTALSRQLPMDLLCQESHVAWQSADCQKVGNAVLKLLCFCTGLFSLVDEGGIFPPDTCAAGVAPSSDSLALVVL